MSGSPGTTYSIGIVGGSIAGCSAAIALLREGHTVTIFERSSSELQGRGAGIMTTQSMLQALKARDMIDADFSHFEQHQMPFIGHTGPDEPFGKTVWIMPANIVLLNWSDLFKNLRRRVPDSIYHAGQTVIAADMVDDNHVLVTMEDSIQHQFDLVIFADGYRSLGRTLLFPEVDLQYRGYVLWRGLLDESKLDTTIPLEDGVPRLSYKGLPGHFNAYFVPGADGETDPGSRRVNWTAYLPLTAEELSAYLIDKNGNLHQGNIPPGMMRSAEETFLKQLMRQHLPPYYADMVEASDDTFIQAIYTMNLPTYYKGHICLCGDAGALAQPFTGSGVFKGVNNALDLAAALESSSSIGQGLSQWSSTQTRMARRVNVLGEQLEKAWIWDTVDFAMMDADEIEAWWHATVAFPEEFSFKEDADSK